jgi:hypothetical protein
MNEKLFKLIDYFRNYTFSNDYTQIHNPPNDLSLNSICINYSSSYEKTINLIRRVYWECKGINGFV